MLCLQLPHLNHRTTYRISVNVFLSPWLTISNFFFTGAWLLYNVVLFSAAQQSQSTIHIHTFPLFWISKNGHKLSVALLNKKWELFPFPWVWAQFSSVAQLCPALCNPMDYGTPGLPVHHQLLEFTQTHVHWVGDAIQPSHPLSTPSPPAFNLDQHQGLVQWVNSSYQVAKIFESQLQNQSSQWTFRTDFL